MSFRGQVTAALASIDHPGDFCGSGELELPLGRLEVEGLGLLPLPIVPLIAQRLAALGTPAPYGRGEATLYDASVRSCLQLPATAVRFGDARWRALLSRLKQKACGALGVDGDTELSLYKLLVYRPGDFFLPHRDTEKRPGMFATVVLVLPGLHEGGGLLVRHGGQERLLALGDRDLGTGSWAAFYADCEHEVTPVTAGHRVALVFNLCRLGTDPPSPPGGHESARAALASALDRWPSLAPAGSTLGLRLWEQSPIEELDREDAVSHKLVWPLSHLYSLAELDFAGLKGVDASRARVLQEVSATNGGVVRLAWLHLEQEGAALLDVWLERGQSTDAFAVMEVHAERAWLDHWQGPRGALEEAAAMPWRHHEVIPRGALWDVRFDEESAHEATGNTGATFERQYRRAALVWWPKVHQANLIVDSGIDAGLDWLEARVDDDDQADACERMIDALLRRWPRPSHAPDQRSQRRARLRDAMLALGADPGGYVDGVIGVGDVGDDDLASTLSFLGADPNLWDGHALSVALDRALANAGTAAEVASLAQAIMLRLPNPTEAAARIVRAARRELHDDPRNVSWRPAAKPAVVALLLWAAGPAGTPDGAPALLDANAAAWGRGRPRDGLHGGVRALTLDRHGEPTRSIEDLALDKRLHPVLDLLLTWGTPPGGWAPRVIGLFDEARAALTRRSAQEPAPYEDWRRPEAGLVGSDQDLELVRAFLRDPSAGVAEWPLAQARRRSLINQCSHVDLSFEVRRKGSPYRLVATKTDDSYRRALAQYSRDRALIERLDRARSSAEKGADWGESTEG